MGTIQQAYEPPMLVEVGTFNDLTRLSGCTVCADFIQWGRLKSSEDPVEEE